MPLYNAGSLMLPESRRVARLLLTHPTKEQWFAALKLDNMLQKKTPATARRQAQLIRKRLDTLEDEAWSLIATARRRSRRSCCSPQRSSTAASSPTSCLTCMPEICAGWSRTSLPPRIGKPSWRNAYSAIPSLRTQRLPPRPRCFRSSSRARRGQLCRFHQDPAAHPAPSPPRCRALPEAPRRNHCASIMDMTR
jgi:hypothetical protein